MLIRLERNRSGVVDLRKTGQGSPLGIKYKKYFQNKLRRNSSAADDRFVKNGRRTIDPETTLSRSGDHCMQVKTHHRNLESYFGPCDAHYK